MPQQVFIQLKKYTHSTSDKIAIKDVCSLQCEDQSIRNKLRSLCIYKFHSDKRRRVVLSSLYIISHLQECISDIEIVPLGPTDIVVKYDPNPPHNKFMDWIKVILICLITFAGAGFSLIAFNSDVNLDLVFSTLHEKLNITDTTNFAILEISYSFGIPLGIMIFYNHFGNKKFSSDPTPLEIEMRLYENDINDSIIDGDNRKEDC